MTATSGHAFLEVCVDCIEGALAAQKGGADRIELCSALSEGGLTPSAGLVRFTAENISVPSFAMIRPRAGDFQYSQSELSVMLRDIEFVRDAGLAGVVIGAQNDAGALALEQLREMKAISQNLGTTLHRVVDVIDDQLLAVDQAIDLGIDRILTSGGATVAIDGANRIAEMNARANGRIAIMPGSGVHTKNVGQLAKITGAREFHASCRKEIRGSGNGEFEQRHQTSADRVVELKRSLDELKF